MFRATSEFRKKLDERLAMPMVVLSFIFLLLVGVLVHGFEAPDLKRTAAWFALLAAFLALWPVFLVEFLVHLLLRERKKGFGRREWYGLLTCLIPPLRIGARVQAMGGTIWIPFLGFRPVNRELRQQLERVFSVPMIVIAVMILPLLALEYGPWQWARDLREHPWVVDFLYVSTVVIWFAFAVEFVVMHAVSANKVAYCARQWLDLTIVLVPLLMFLGNLGFLRLSRLARLEQLGRLARVYRFRGLWMRAWRAVILLELINRLLSTPQKRITKLRDRIALKEEEIRELQKEIRALEEKMEAKQPATPAPAEPERQAAL